MNLRQRLRNRRETRDRRYHERMLALGYRGVYCQPEVGLPEGYDPPSAALALPPPRVDAS